MFVRPLGDSYALHPLLREFLRARLAEERDAAELSELASARGGRSRLERPNAGGDRALAGRLGTSSRRQTRLRRMASRWRPRRRRRLPAGSTGFPRSCASDPVLRLLAGRAGDGGGGLRRRGRALPGRGLRARARAALPRRCSGQPASPSPTPRSRRSTSRRPPRPAAAPMMRARRPGRPPSSAPSCTPPCWRAWAWRGPIAPWTPHSSRPSARELLGPGLAAFRAHYRELPAGRLDDALEHINEGIAALRGPGSVQPPRLRAGVQDGDSRGAGRARAGARGLR